MIKSSNSSNYIGDELELFKNATNWKSYFSENIGKYIHGEVLEVGAGIGINTKYMFETSNKVTSWSLVEPDVSLVKQIKSNTANLNLPRKTIINGNIQDLKGKKFDTIIYIDVLEHIEDSKNEIELIKTLLYPNGYAIILVPAFNFMYNDFDKRIGHYRRYNKKLLKKELNAQLSIVKMFYLDSTGFFASLLNKLILKKDLPSTKDILFWDKIMIPISKVLDLLFFKAFGKSLIGIFKNDE